MKKTWKRIISLLMTVTMLGSIAAVYANAATASTVKTYNTYLSLGDSIAAGFGLSDYCNKLKGDNIILSKGDYYSSTGGKVSIPTRIKGSYTDLVAKAVGASKVYAYACPGFRSSEIRMLIDDSYDGDWVVKGKAITELSCFKGVVITFHGSIIIRAAGTAHTLSDIPHIAELSKLSRSKLYTLI